MWFFWGCTPALSNMMPARTTPDGRLQVVTAIEGSLPLGDYRDIMEKLNSIKKVRTITPEQARILALGSAAFLIQPPGANPHATFSYGLSRRFDIGFRTGSNIIKGWGRYQLLRVSPGFYSAVGIGIGTYFSGFPVENYTSLARTTDYSRNEMDLPVQFGFSGRIGHIWFGPKFVFADYNLEADVCSYKDATGCLRWGDMSSEGTVSYFGGHLGGAIGYKRIWFAAEISVIHLDIDSDIEINVQSVSEEFELGDDGWVISPTLGLILWF